MIARPRLAALASAALLFAIPVWAAEWPTVTSSPPLALIQPNVAHESTGTASARRAPSGEVSAAASRSNSAKVVEGPGGATPAASNCSTL